MFGLVLVEELIDNMLDFVDFRYKAAIKADPLCYEVHIDVILAIIAVSRPLE